MQRTRFTAALASVAVSIAAALPAAVSAQTTMAPTPGTVVGPTTMPKTPAPMMMSAPPMSKPAGGAMMPVTGTLALDARAVRARKTSTGYTLSGQALVKDACQAARFDQFLGNIFPPQFNLTQFRRPGTMGVLCVMRLMWVTAQPRKVVSAAPPRYVTVCTKKGCVRVPVS